MRTSFGVGRPAVMVARLRGGRHGGITATSPERAAASRASPGAAGVDDPVTHA